MAKPISPQERDRIIAEFATGKPCKQIAREFQRSPDTISRIARTVGHQFGRTNLENARAANLAYGAERRANIRLKTVEIIEDRLRDFNRPTLVYSFGGKGNIYNERTLEKPDARTMRDLAQTVSTLWRVVKDIDAAETTQHDDSALDRIFEEISRIAHDDNPLEPETGAEHHRLDS